MHCIVLRSTPHRAPRPPLRRRSVPTAPLLALLWVGLGVACSDEGSGPEPAMAGVAGNAGAAGSDPSGSAGASGSSGSGGGGVTPDPAKNCEAAASSAELPGLQLTLLVDGLTRPVYLTQPKGETERLFVVEKPGSIRIVRDGELLDAPFLDIQDAVSERGQEMGLLGLAFHPAYAENRRFFVYYSRLDGNAHRSRLAEFSASADNPDQADPSSERVLLELDQPQDNHNGGSLEFGPDGMLYVGLGDGGGANDQHGSIGNGQNLGTLLGKLLRIDVDGTGAGPNQAYAIPEGNLERAGALPEIWSYGLRNPWRFSFDACTGDMYIGDVGQGEIEEVDFEPANSAGRNYGWRLMEGDNCFNPSSGCNANSQNLVLPVASYDHDMGQSITGGYVYRGHAIEGLRGTYLYADYSSARFFALRMSAGSVALEQTEITSNINPGTAVRDITSFGQDEAGELYVLEFDGGVFRIDPE